MNNQNETPLFDAVKKYVDDGVTPFHVPGHKHGRGISELRDYIGSKALNMDVNGMADLDYFNNPTGVIYESEKLLASAFGAEEAFFLLNGTTSGIHAMIMSVCKPGDEIIIPRNAHKSVIGGIILSGAKPVYIYPEVNDEIGIANGVTVEKVERAIESHPNAKAVLIINPTYYGYTSDIKSIVKIAHEKNMLVLVDEAHGPHMHFHDALPLTAMESGADMSVISMHKTCGSLTQSSALLIRNKKISPRKVRDILNLIYTSSGSYLLMCSIDIARKQIAIKGRDMLENTLQIARWAREEINKIDGLYAFGKELIGKSGCFDFDETKLSINVIKMGYTGYELESILREEYNIQIELADLNNILAIISIGDRLEDIEKLVKALKDISLKNKKQIYNKVEYIPAYTSNMISPREAYYMNKRLLKLSESEGKIAGEMVMAYPPGIPVICIGEVITKEIIDYINILKNEKCQLQGTTDPLVNHIKVLDL
ncbi:arginine decarboxylase SpeA [Gottschalkia acidurici 9a]|uniref:Arginine decarboxylase SpeA n=1 Tax=Gottschalkia acidurici (strain ATCC 7906 / DSM 604 / BCRC 14475 / CIP 104303 / KCTC 5404 / NCIMB 10678 / 9a) TaxID=1128398 RepID=K0B125_GOTA9|nr:aminotransferase class I/II-fold pyridoxal phosphate-dependent enzyme [Gottschalkia acidurici]AFS78772.1 arginine decarboxylase SpeA [Gottschalkia acidurici 9a]